MIDNNPAPSRLVNADALCEELKFYPRRPRLKSVRPGQARHFATHTQGLFRVKTGKALSEHIQSGLPSKQTSSSRSGTSDSCHNRKSTTLFDHLAGAGEQLTLIAWARNLVTLITGGSAGFSPLGCDLLASPFIANRHVARRPLHRYKRAPGAGYVSSTTRPKVLRKSHSFDKSARPSLNRIDPPNFR